MYMVDRAYNPSAWEVEEMAAITVSWPLGVLCLSVEEMRSFIPVFCTTSFLPSLQ
jgi:hypothetical protein